MKLSRAIFISCGVAIVVAAYAVYENTAIQISRYEIANEKISKDNFGLRICHLSDIHVKASPQDYGPMIKATAEARPDIIAISGDLIDSRASDISAAVSLCETLSDIAPVYFVTGNHEEGLPADLYIKAIGSLRLAGIHVLDGRAEFYEKNGAKINIIGMSDSEYPDLDSIKELCRPNVYNVLICHRPQFAEEYAASGADLTLCGHAHGGQARIPFIGGVIAPDQYFFPKYYEGKHNFGDRAVIISRGIGNSLIPIRINNRPEVVIIDLKADKDG